MTSDWLTAFELGETIMNYKYLMVIVLIMGALDTVPVACSMGNEAITSGWLLHPPGMGLNSLQLSHLLRKQRQ